MLLAEDCAISKHGCTWEIDHFFLFGKTWGQMLTWLQWIYVYPENNGDVGQP